MKLQARRSWFNSHGRHTVRRISIRGGTSNGFSLLNLSTLYRYSTGRTFDTRASGSGDWATTPYASTWNKRYLVFQKSTISIPNLHPWASQRAAGGVEWGGGGGGGECPTRVDRLRRKKRLPLPLHSQHGIKTKLPTSAGHSFDPQSPPLPSNHQHRKNCNC